ncbi:MAG: ABC transporter permease [Acidobacteriaceae bacterium]
MHTILQDLRYACRQFRKSLGFTVIAVASLALAIGANTTIFSFANQMLFVKLAVPHPNELRVLSITGDKNIPIHFVWGSMTGVDGVSHTTSFSYPVYRELKKQTSVTEPIFAFKSLGSVNVTANGSAQAAQAELVSGNFYAQMQLKPELGRPVLPSDDGAPGSGTVAVISDAFWHAVFGGSPNVIGKTITVDMTPVTIVGVNPPSFKTPDAPQSIAPQLFLPLSLISVFQPSSKDFDPLGPNVWWLQLMARTRPGVSDARAQAALNVALSAAVHATMSLTKDDTMPHLQLSDGSHGNFMDVLGKHQQIYLLLGFACLVLLLACANIANLMLARASGRQREMSVRMALGAGRTRVLRQVLTESLLLSAMGGVAGLFIGYLCRGLLPWLSSSGWQGDQMAVAFNWRVFAFTSAVTLLTGVLFGIAPAWRATHAEINTALKEGSRGASRRRTAWSGKAIVGFQLALSTVLIISSALFLRTILNLYSVNPGFNTDNLLLVGVDPPEKRYPAPTDVALQHRLEDAFAAVPGVKAVAMAKIPLIADNMWNDYFHVEGAKVVSQKDSSLSDLVNLDIVSPNFFSTMSIPILAGRAFNATDTATSVPVAVINQALARKFFPHANPIGKRFRLATVGPDVPRWIEVIGICANTRYSNLQDADVPIHFELSRQEHEIDGVTFLIRSPLKPAQLVPALRRVTAQIDPDLPLTNIRTQQQQIDETLQTNTMFAALTTGFGLLALALACVGIYGVMAYTVSQRTNEIGIRLALGAMREQVRAMVLRETGWLAASGVLIGLVTTLLLLRLIRSMLYGLKPTDPLTLASSVLLLLVMAFVAGLIPATRASRVEPIQALRTE